MAQLLGGALIIKDEPEWSETRDGWDELRHMKIALGATAHAALAVARFTLGGRPSSSLVPTGTMVCVKRSAKRYKANYWECSAEYLGISSVKPYKRTIRTYPDKARGTVGKFAGGVPYVQEVEINENLVGISVQYVAHAAPSAAWVGYPAYPLAGAVAVPRPHWDALSNPLEVVPNGWVLDSLEAEELPGNTMCLVRADYVYYQRYKPGSGSF